MHAMKMQTRIMRMRMLLAGALLAVALVGAAPRARAHAQDAPPPAGSPSDVVVTAGEGLVLAAPDRAFVSISAEARAKTPKEAQQMNANAMTAVQAKLKSAGIPTDAVRTIALDLQPDFDYANGKQTLRGYVARNTIEVRVDEIAKVGEIVDAAIGSGATSVSHIRFDLKDRDATEKKALAQAVADARGRAEALAQASNRAFDRILRIEDQSERGAPPPRPMVAFRQAAAEAATTPVTPGQLEIRARVSMTVKLK